MPVDLSAPLSWKAAAGDASTMLDELQPNILKEHVRDHLSVLLLRFLDRGGAKSFLNALVTGAEPLMKSARTQLEELEAYRSRATRGTPYVGVGLSKSGYEALGVTDAQQPNDTAFRRGMKALGSRQALADPPISTWEAPYRDDIHAVVLIGDASDATTSARRNEIVALLPDTVTVVGEESGLSQRNERGDGIEHFGYVDGRSQPLFLTEEIDKERDSTDGNNVWDPSFALNRVLVNDPAAPKPTVHCGSYLIFRKLEQNVRRFKQAEEDLATELGLEDEDRERVGAMLVGRFEDGTPLTVQRGEGTHDPVMNDFTYDSDGQGAKCPFQAHIRKMNPRGSGGVQPLDKERLHLMARRGVTFGERIDVPLDHSVPPAGRPSGGVGLLFMAFNANVSTDDDSDLSQFDFTQRVCANNPDFPKVPPETPAPGLDPVIGQGARPAQTYKPQWGGTQSLLLDAFAEAVRMKGGEYFFMPSLAFLRSL